MQGFQHAKQLRQSARQFLVPQVNVRFGSEAVGLVSANSGRSVLPKSGHSKQQKQTFNVSVHAPAQLVACNRLLGRHSVLHHE